MFNNKVATNKTITGSVVDCDERTVLFPRMTKSKAYYNNNCSRCIVVGFTKTYTDASSPDFFTAPSRIEEFIVSRRIQQVYFHYTRLFIFCENMFHNRFDWKRFPTFSQSLLPP